MKICAQCEHYQYLSDDLYKYDGDRNLCYAKASVDVVSGTVIPNYARLMREQGADKCGPEGRLFEPKVSILDRIKTALTRS